MHLFLNKPKSTHFSSVCNNSTVANFIFSYMNIIEISLHTLFYMLASINEEHVSTGEARAEDSETLSECPQLLTISLAKGLRSTPYILGQRRCVNWGTPYSSNLYDFVVIKCLYNAFLFLDIENISLPVTEFAITVHCLSIRRTAALHQCILWS